MLSPIVLQWPQSRSPERPRVQWPALSVWSLGLGLRPYYAAPSSGSLLLPQNGRKWGNLRTPQAHIVNLQAFALCPQLW